MLCSAVVAIIVIAFEVWKKNSKAKKRQVVTGCKYLSVVMNLSHRKYHSRV